MTTWWRRLCQIWHTLLNLDATHAAAADHRHEILDTIRVVAAGLRVVSAGLEEVRLSHGRGVGELRETLRAEVERLAQKQREILHAVRSEGADRAVKAHRHTEEMGAAVRQQMTELLAEARAEAHAATEGLLAAARNYADALSERDRAYAEQLAEQSREHAAALQRWAESRGLTLAVPTRGPRQFTYEDRQ